MKLPALIAFVICVFIGNFAKSATASAHHLSVGQGVVSPSGLNFLNYSSGWVSQNPTGAMYQPGWRLTGQIAQNGNDTVGGEFGYGNSLLGIGVGTQETDCDTCDNETAGAVGMNMANTFSFGLRFMEDLYSVGINLNPIGVWRVGLVGELNEVDGDNNNITRLGAGFGYFAPLWTFVVDASHRLFEDPNKEDDRFVITPGLSLRTNVLQVSVNYEMAINEDPDDKSVTDYDDHFWLGIGYSGPGYHLAFYSDYVEDISFNLTINF